jgi:hypothetical protein
MKGDIQLALRSLMTLLAMLPDLRVIALVGKKAALAAPEVRVAKPAAAVFEIPHPSPLFVNRSPGNRELLLSALLQVCRAAHTP